MRLDYGGLFEGWELAIARRLIKAYQLEWPALGAQDFEDLLQECLLHWHGVRERYDGERGASPRTFMARVIRNKLMDIVRELEADKRKIAGLAVSLDAPPAGRQDDGTAESELGARLSDASSEEALQQRELAADLEEAMNALSVPQRALCEALLRNDFNMKQASEWLGTPRATLYDELKRIRRLFRKKGLDAYLD